MMRQAGRYLPEYRELRSRNDFLDCVHDPDLAAELTLQPLRRFRFDAGILFCDILIVLEAMGLRVDFPAGGPQVHPTLEGLDFSKLRKVDAEDAFSFVREALQLVRRGIEGDEHVVGHDRALLGFAGAPFTLACYAVEGGGSSKEFSKVRTLMRQQPERFDELLSRLSDVIADLLVLQVDAGADAVQLFDTWGGLLSEHDWRKRVAPHVTRIVERVHAAGGRCIVYVKDTSHLVPAILGTGCDAMGVDWRTDLAACAELAAARSRPCAVQGNIDPTVLFAPTGVIRAEVERARSAVAGTTGHIVNLGHGVLPGTPVSGVAAFVEAATSSEAPGSGTAR